MRDNKDSLVIPKVVSEVADMVGIEKTVELAGLSLENVNKKNGFNSFEPLYIEKKSIEGYFIIFLICSKYKFPFFCII